MAIATSDVANQQQSADHPHQHSSRHQHSSHDKRRRRRRPDERFSIPSFTDSSNIFERLLKKLEHLMENVANNVTATIRFQVSQAIIDVLNKNQITQVTNNAMLAISQNVSTLIDGIPFNQLLENSLQNSQPIVNQVAKQLMNQEVIDTVKLSLKANDVDFSTIVSEIINATIQQLSTTHTKQEINTMIRYYAGHITDAIPAWMTVLLVGVFISIVMIPSLLITIILQQVFPVRKMKWYQRIFIDKKKKESDEETRHLVYEQNVQQ